MIGKPNDIKESKVTDFNFSTSPLVCVLNGHTFTGQTPRALALKVRRYIREEGFGASDIGSKFSVRKDLCVVGTLSYNGNYTKRDMS